MVKASKGYRRRTRSVMQKRSRDRGLSPITKEFRKFEVGDNVHIEIDPSIHKGQPHIRFHGLTARVAGMQGKSYVLDVYAGNKKKQVIVRPQHLRKAAK